MSWQIITGDCIEQMRELEPESVDAIVTDPPYELGFMGKGWDASGIANSVEMWGEALRVLKPGGHLLAFGGTRTYHRMVCAVEDAGFEIRDQIAWMFGSGFPKSLDVSKAIDKAAGVEREVVSRETTRWIATGRNERYGDLDGFEKDENGYEVRETTAPATPEAEEWQGWGTALKPAFEPIVVARKPLIGTVAANVLEHGTGAINVDGCRIPVDPEDEWAKGVTWTSRPSAIREGTVGFVTSNDDGERREVKAHDDGRWPANVAMDPEAGAMLDEQTGDLKSGFMAAGQQREGIGYHGGLGNTVANDTYGDTGGASRFFYCAKTSSAERNAGLDGFDVGDHVHFGSGGRTQVDGEWVETHSEPQKRANVHPTVKPIALMRWLCRMVTPPGGTLLDPFNGSGSTGCAAVLEGFNYIGIEREPEYVEIASARIAWWEQHPEGMELGDRLKADKASEERAASGQDSLFGEVAA